MTLLPRRRSQPLVGIRGMGGP